LQNLGDAVISCRYFKINSLDMTNYTVWALIYVKKGSFGYIHYAPQTKYFTNLYLNNWNYIYQLDINNWIFKVKTKILIEKSFLFLLYLHLCFKLFAGLFNLSWFAVLKNQIDSAVCSPAMYAHVFIQFVFLLWIVYKDLVINNAGLNRVIADVSLTLEIFDNYS